ncbi:glycerol-3-phosphate responsive antiterminator [Clostridium sp. DL1XJH146]
MRTKQNNDVNRKLFVENPVIAAIRNNDDLKKVIETDINIVFVLYGNIMELKGVCTLLKRRHKKVFIHIDLIEGLKADEVGIRFIKTYIKPDGIITTKARKIRYAKSQKLFTIQRIFIVDSLSIKTGVHSIIEDSPDAIEVLPGIASIIIEELEKKIHIPIIAGGFIKTKEDVLDSIYAGAISVSTTKRDLWNTKY